MYLEVFELQLCTVEASWWFSTLGGKGGAVLSISREVRPQQVTLATQDPSGYCGLVLFVVSTILQMHTFLEVKQSMLDALLESK